MRLISNSVKRTLIIGSKIAANLRKGDILCLSGELGSGKTVLIKGIASGLGINKDKVISPTFILMREHRTKENTDFYHFDFYRLKDYRDILILGYEEYFYADAITAIEWPNRMKHLIPQERLDIGLSVKGVTARLINITAQGSRYKQLLRNINADFRR